jgi:hypothetical protein
MIFYSFIHLFELVWAFNILQEIYFKRDILSQIPFILKKNLIKNENFN